MVPLLFAAYIESRSPGISPLRPPVPIVQLHRTDARAVTERLAESIDLSGVLVRSSDRIDTPTATQSVENYTTPVETTAPGAWPCHGTAFFVG